MLGLAAIYDPAPNIAEASAALSRFTSPPWDLEVSARPTPFS